MSRRESSKTQQPVKVQGRWCLWDIWKSIAFQTYFLCWRGLEIPCASTGQPSGSRDVRHEVRRAGPGLCPSCMSPGDPVCTLHEVKASRWYTVRAISACYLQPLDMDHGHNDREEEGQDWMGQRLRKRQRMVDNWVRLSWEKPQRTWMAK